MNLAYLWNKYRSVVSYLFFGAVTTVLNVVTYSLCYEYAEISNVLSTIIAWVAAVTVAFVTNKLFVFDSKSWDTMGTVKEALDFMLCRVGTGIVELVMMYILVDICAFNGTVVKLMTNVVVIVLNYIASKFWIFKGE